MWWCSITQALIEKPELSHIRIQIPITVGITTGVCVIVGPSIERVGFERVGFVRKQKLSHFFIAAPGWELSRLDANMLGGLGAYGPGVGVSGASPDVSVRMTLLSCSWRNDPNESVGWEGPSPSPSMPSLTSHARWRGG